MSQTDSFIAEVTEEVKRDRLYGYARRYGWIAILLIVALVGGAAWREYALANRQAKAEAFGAAVSVALEGQDPAQRLADLTAIATEESGAGAVRDLLAAEQAVAGEDFATARDLLDRVANSADLPVIYRQIARFKYATQAAQGLDVATRRAALAELDIAGQPLRLLAQEQLVLLDLESGNRDAAVALARSILADAEVSSEMSGRIANLMAALDVSLDEDTDAETSE